MKKFNYYLAMSLLCSATFVGTLTSCNKDDDKDSGSTTQTTGTKPVKDTDFKVSVDGNTITVTSNLTYGNQWVTFEGSQYNLKDGKVEITQPVAGTYKATLSYYDNGQTISSDEFEITITASNLGFLDKGIYKLLSGGQAAYEEAKKSADANGVFTRAWRLDGFVNADAYQYSKVFSGPGTFCSESDKKCYNGGVTATGKDAWRKLGALEDMTISFDLVSKKVKVVVKDANKLQTTTVPNAVNTASAIAEGTYYGTFNFKEMSEGSAEFLSFIDGWAGSETDEIGLEINMSGENIRIPFCKEVMSWPLTTEEKVTNVRVFASKSKEDQEDGLMILTSVTYNTEAKNAAEKDNPDAEQVLKDDPCDMILTYVAEELDDTYKYSSATPNYVEPINTEATVETVDGIWKYYEVPFNWIGWQIPEKEGEVPAGKVLNDWFVKSDMADWATVDATVETAEFSFTVTDKEAGTGECNINGVETTYKVADGVITFGAEVNFKAGSVDIKGTEFYIVNAEGPGVWIGQKNGDKNETQAVLLFKGFTAGGGNFNSSWDGDWNSNVTLNGNGDYTLEFAGKGESYGFYIDFNNVLYKYKDFSVQINKIEIDGNEIILNQESINATKDKGDNEFTVRYYLVNPWGTSGIDAFTANESVKVYVTVSGM